MTESILFPLQDAYDDYFKSKIGKKELESIIFSHILKSPQRFSFDPRKKDELVEYLCWVYPRFGRSIDRYKNQGSTFDAYIRSVIKMSYKEYCLKKRDEEALENSWWNANAEESYAASTEAEYDACEIKKPLCFSMNAQRQILFLLLKCYYFLSEDLIDKIYPALDVEKKYLVTMIEGLHEVRKRQEDEVAILRRRIDTQYYRCVCYESRMRAAPEGSSHYERMKRCLEKSRVRLRSMRKHLSHMRLNASNRQVAEILGVPKGTIDSSISMLKERKKID